MRPGTALPSVTDMRLAKTASEITPGMEAGLNQLLAKIEGEFRIKILPTAAKMEPIKHHSGCYTSRRVLIHTPHISKAPPIEQPVFIPNLSKIQLVGKAPMGCRTGKNRVNRVTTTWSYLYLSLTSVLMLANVWAGNEFAKAANI